MYEVATNVVMPDKKKAVERGKAMVLAGRSRREVAAEIYAECYWNKEVQASTYQRRIRHLVEVLAKPSS